MVTGSRADYGLLQPIIQTLSDTIDFDLSIVATGTHLSPEFGLTYQEIIGDGFPIDAKIEILLSSDSSVGTAKSMGLAVSGFADTFNKLNPDYVLLLGDRFEILAAAQTALVMCLPIIHFSGGDVTSGAFDDAIRHAITKMASIHFVASKDAAYRVLQMGEEKQRVHIVGDPGLDALRTMKLMLKKELEKNLGFKFHEKNFLITFHPATLDTVSSTDQFTALLGALDFYPDVGLIFTRPNADPDGRRLIKILDSFAKSRSNTIVFTSLGHHRYLSVMNQVSLVIGNSSSGLLEAPSLKKPVVNIGGRQEGRLRASCVLDCPPERDDIRNAIKKALVMNCSKVINPYGDGYTAEKVIEILRRYNDPRSLVRKKFIDRPLDIHGVV